MMAQGKTVRIGHHDLHFDTIDDLKVFIKEELERLVAIERDMDADSERDGKVWQLITDKAALLDVLIAGYEDWIRTDTQELDDQIEKVRSAIRQIGDPYL